MAKRKKTANKIRITINDYDSHAVLYSKATTKKTLTALIITIVLVIIALTYVLLSFTPLRHTIKGYPSKMTQQTAISNQLKIDSLEREISLWALQVGNIQRIITGQEPISMESLAYSEDSVNVLDYYRLIYAQQDSILRNEVRAEEQFNLAQQKIKINQIEGLHFFTPVKGIITEGYNKAIDHPYIDIAAAEGTSVFSILDGTVISAGWNDDTGYTIQIQHDNNLISIYKHNEELLKSIGDKVQAGSPIAIVGNTGRLSTGTHLHFELWHEGEAIDPTMFITF
ncbi:MAG: M23 family metallopeptidase [Bacteroidales bacterium]|nr:M23 family metallopeptidase [Bacteroidales bacterium]